MPTSSALRSFAEDPPAWGEIDPRSGLTRVLTDQYCVLFGSSPTTTLVSRLRLDPDEIPETIHEVRKEIARRGHREAVWRVGSSATPADLADRLVGRGFVPADLPGHEPHLTSMVLTEEPPSVEGVEVRRVADAAELARASSISAIAFGEEEDAENWEERFAAERAGLAPRMYLAFVDGTPVGAARALFEDGLPAVMLISGGVLAEARGHGAYRALVRARWDDAVRAGQNALVVHAGAMSRPILERLGFHVAAEQEVLLDPTGAEIIDDERYFAAIIARGKYVNVFRPRFAPEAAAEVLAEIRSLAPSAIGSWQTDSRELADALVAAGARRPAPPLEWEFTALATATAPPAVTGFEIRRIESFDDYLVGLEIALSAEQYTDEARAHRRAEAEEAYERRKGGPSMEWLASIDGEPVAHARAFPGPRGLLLDGGATLPSARGRGAYRALIAARWEEAVTRGTPALVVQAQETSRPILERCGFEVVCTMYEVEHDPS